MWKWKSLLATLPVSLLMGRSRVVKGLSSSLVYRLTNMKERLAFICEHPDHAKNSMAYRVFLLPGEPQPPRCSEHNRPMARQSNRPYRAKKRK